MTKKTMEIGSRDRSVGQPDQRAETVSEVEKIEMLQLCINNTWDEVLARIIKKPELATCFLEGCTNKKKTTVLHQAISGKGEGTRRAEVISTVLQQTPEASEMKNTRGCLPLHTICWGVSGMDSKTTERLILELIQANARALIEPIGTNMMTPLHIAASARLLAPQIKILIENGKSACFMKGRLPVHIACQYRCSREQLQLYLNAYPESISEVDGSGKSLVDIAKMTGTKAKPIDAILSELQSRDGATARTVSEEIKLLRLSRDNDWDEVLALIIKKPSLATRFLEQRNGKTTILHQAILRDGDVSQRAKVISTILKQTPKASEMKNCLGSLPLHSLCSRLNVMDSLTTGKLIRKLIAANAGALLEPNGASVRTPLHIAAQMAAQCRRSTQVIKILIEKGKSACYMKDSKERFPVHIACRYHCSLEQLRLYLDADPQSITQLDASGQSLLDIAKSTGRSPQDYELVSELGRRKRLGDQSGVQSVSEVEKIELLNLCLSNGWDEVLARLIRKPSVATCFLKRKTTLLHQAIFSDGYVSRRAKVISTVLKQTPKASEMKNCQGSLPLHSFCSRLHVMDSSTTGKLIRKLIKANVGALLEPNGVSKGTPLHIAAQSAATSQLSSPHIKMLIDKGRRACFMRDRNGRLPVHVACSYRCSREQLRLYLDAYPLSISELCDYGKSLVEVAESTDLASFSPPHGTDAKFTHSLSEDTAENGLLLQRQDEDTFHQKRGSRRVGGEPIPKRRKLDAESPPDICPDGSTLSFSPCDSSAGNIVLLVVV